MLIAAGLTALTGARPAEALGLPDPGELTTVGLPAVRAFAQVSMVTTIGALLLAAFLAPPQRSGYLDVAGYRAVRVGSYAAALWAACALLLIPLNVADALGRPVSDVLDIGLLGTLVPKLAAGISWTLTALIALLVMVGCRLVLSWGWSVVVFGLAVAGPLPVALTGHSAGGGAHDVATNSLVLHVLAAALWVGGLIAIVAVATGGAGPDRKSVLATAVPRFSRLALVCWVALAATGILNALVRIPLGDLLGSTYGWLIVGKMVALVVLGALGAAHRRRSVDAAARGETGALVRLGAVEVLIMLGTIGLAVALGRSAPPQRPSGPPSVTEVLIGYDLYGPPTIARLLFDWRFDLIYGSLAIAGALIYLAGVRRLRRRGDAWPTGRIVAWLSGCAVLLIATSSGIGRYSPAMFSVHMSGHMTLSMLAPILLVLGAPMTLALRALPVAGKTAPPGPREWLLAAVHSPAARWLTHPLIALALFVSNFYILYFTSLFALALREHWAHVAMNAHFLLVGTLFFWPLIGIDPAPRRLAPIARLAVVFAAVPFHAFFGIALMSTKTVIGETFYRGLALPWVPDLLHDQQVGGGVAWGSGELPILLVVIALVVQWSRLDERSARRDDRRADADGDADLKAYNAMLRRLATGSATSTAQEPDPTDVTTASTRDERSTNGDADDPSSAAQVGVSARQMAGGRDGTPNDHADDARPLVAGNDLDETSR
ncbi:copper resistance protein D [Pseudonocardia asaccharolytica DSM 44247 = NBRC 16224]|uniref:Copper resistance protein D n=1 Tax=Pseudonocardia asaccharolytica DSM 44247 = NBRC 16224 TaxID=1123024 RepID=A0A511D800_9PSEU|nr:copper resistance protein D [Pseudonocardia asaccharolytica DSM 44247 = NBRC 16224]